MTTTGNDQNRNLPPFIGLWSPAPGCGKSTVAHYLGDLQPGYLRVGFADPPKRMLQELLCAVGYRWHEAHRFIWWEKDQPLLMVPGQPTARDLIKSLCEEWAADSVHEELLAMIWAAKVQARTRVVADDVRKPDQARRILSMGGEIWAVTRPGFSDDSGHRSEAGLGDVPITRVIVNDGSLAELRQAVEVVG